MRTLPLLLVAALLPACASTKGEGFTKVGLDPMTVKHIAVVDGNNPTFKVETRQKLCDATQMEFFKRGWPVIERMNIQKALDEVTFQNGEVTSPDERQKLGHVLNVDALAFVNISGTTDEMSVTIKMVDVQSGEVLWMGQGEAELRSGLAVMAGALTGAVIGAAAGNNVGHNNAGTGAGIGGIAGGMIGASLTPSGLENAKDLVKDICKDIPQRGPKQG